MNLVSFFIYSFSFFMFLFCLYALSHDDFILLRKNISIEMIFNSLFIIAGVSFFTARLLYILFSLQFNLLHPFYFLLFPYYSGLSFAGGILGGMFGTILVGMYKKMPTKRILDIVSLSFLSGFSVYLFFQFCLEFILLRKIPIIEGISLLFYSIVFAFLLRIFLTGKSKDGTTSFLFIALFSLFSFLLSLFIGKGRVVLFFTREDFLYIPACIVSFIILFREENLWERLKKIDIKQNIQNNLRKLPFVKK